MMRRGGRLLVLTGALVLIMATAAVADQMRIVTWNVTNYSGGRVPEFETAIYGEYVGRSMTPDVFVGQEFISDVAAQAFLAILNGAPNSPGDWAMADFVNGPDTDSVLFYRTSVVQLVTEESPNGVTVVATGGYSPKHPRNIMRYDIRPAGLTAPNSTLAVYSTHMKAGSETDDQARRFLEAQRIRDDAENLPTGWNFLVAGDFNIQSSGQSAYQELVGSQGDNTGRFHDPINTPGVWNNRQEFRFVHTQEPTGTYGGMDDRHDQILISESLLDGVGFDYVGDPAIPYSTVTWDDANHSYRAWGNDGSSYNGHLNTWSNTMVGNIIAQAIVDTTEPGGHIPIFADFYLPDETLGVCCTPCGCLDGIDVNDCGAIPGGDWRGVGLNCGEENPLCNEPPLPTGVKINEVLIAHSGFQDKEFIELVGPADADLCKLSLLVAEGEGGSRGVIDVMVPLTDCGGGVPCSLDASGYFVAGGSGLSPAADLVIDAGVYLFENATETFLLVHDCPLAQGDDIDLDNDGVVDGGIGTVLDAVGLVDGDYPADDVIYADAPAFGPDAAGGVPAGAARCPNGVDTDRLADWVRLSAAGDGSAGCVPASPTTANPGACGGDADGDGDYDLADFARFQRCLGETSVECSAFELDGQCGITIEDLPPFFDRLTGP